MSAQPFRPLSLRRLAVVALSVGTLCLAACTSAPPVPEVTNAPERTTGTVRVAALTGDDDAALQARASVLVLRQAGFDASLSGVKDLSAANASESLSSRGVDVVFGGSESWLAGLPQTAAGEAGSASGSATPPASGASGASAPASATPSGDAADGGSADQSPAVVVPKDQQAARDATAARLPEGLAIGTVAQPDRRLVAAMSRGVASRLKIDSIATLAPHCPEITVAAQPEWFDQRKAGFESSTSCAVGQDQSLPTAAQALAAVADGKADLAVLTSDDPDITRWGQRVLDDPNKALPADPVLGVISSERVGKDALAKLTDVSQQLQGENFLLLQRLASEGTVSDADLGRWLVQRGLLKGDDAGNPAPATPTPAS